MYVCTLRVEGTGGTGGTRYLKNRVPHKKGMADESPG